MNDPRPLRAILPLLTVCGLAATAQAQVIWTRSLPSAVPTASKGPKAAYAGAGEVILFGGAAGVTRSAETWSWDGSDWSPRTAAGGPPARGGHAMASDSYRSVVVLFGGYGDSGALDDTWEWSGGTWTRRSTALAPSPRSGHAMVYDQALQRVVLFGGVTPTGTTLDDTWEWDGNTWAQRSVIGSQPPARSGHAMVCSNQGTMMFGGWDNTGTVPPDTWIWDGWGWTVIAQVGPGARHHHQMVFDESRGVVVLFGGANYFDPNGPVTYDQTWEWDGGWTWVLPWARPAPRHNHAMAYDFERRRTVCFGGQTTTSTVPLIDTWEYHPYHEPVRERFGQGCAGSGGTPFLTSYGNLPWLGETVTLSLFGAAPTGTAFLILGDSRTSHLGTPLPLSLGSRGAPGCDLLVAPAATAWLPTTGTLGSFALQLPGERLLLGVPFFLQVFELDPPANALGITTSNGLELQIGAR